MIFVYFFYQYNSNNNIYILCISHFTQIQKYSIMALFQLHLLSLDYEAILKS